MITTEIDNNKIKIGKNVKENDEMIKLANQDFWWFHLSSFPSCHVIAETDTLNDRLISECAFLCKKNTKYRNLPNLYVDYTKINNLIFSKNPGEISYKNKKNIYKIKI